MIEDREVPWDEAVSSGNYVKWNKIKEGVYEPTVIKIKNWKNTETTKAYRGNEPKRVVEFSADVVEEGGKIVEKTFTTTSDRLKSCLRDILIERSPSEIVKLSILPVGEDFNRNYAVKEIKE